MDAGADVTIWIAFSAGVLSYFSPCVMPLIPSFLTYISGLSFAEIKAVDVGARVRLTVILHSLVFIAGFSAVRSITCTSTLVRSMCLRNSWPSPTPSLAPSINPGMSAATNES